MHKTLVSAWMCTTGNNTVHTNSQLQYMAVASGPAGPVLDGPVFKIVFGIAHVQNSINVRKSKNNDHACTS